MRDTLCLLVCETVFDEVEQIVRDEGFADVAVRAYPLGCALPGPTVDAPRQKILAECRSAFSSVEVVGECLASGAHDGASGRRAVRLGVCFELLVNAPLVRHHLDQRAFLTTPGWLRRWRAVVAAWGFDETTAREFFGETSARIVLLDTGSDPSTTRELAAFALHVGLPAERIPVGLDHLRGVIARRVLAWQLSLRPSRQQLSEAHQRAAETAMALDLLGNLTAGLREGVVLEGILNLFGTLCAPSGLLVVPFRDGHAGQAVGRPKPSAEAVQRRVDASVLDDTGGDGAWSVTPDGFVVSVVREGCLLAVIDVSGVALPAYRDRYVSLALGIRPVIALAIANARELEERLSLEAGLRDSQRLAAIGTLARGIGHEIANPLNVVLNFAQLIVDDDPPEPFASYGAEILRASERMGVIVNELRQFSDQAKQTLVPAEMHRVVGGCLALVSKTLQAEGVALAVDVPDDLPLVPCYVPQLQQVLVNLLLNAGDAVAALPADAALDRTVTLSARVVDAKEGPRVRVTVEDTGEGIADDRRERLFEPFFTTRSRVDHAGLGLTVSRRLVLALGGELWCESGPGRGARFHVDLPVSFPAAG